jgi:mRNA-degrading endonuclease toxin of MazEF toxin-antitoxin module
MVESQPFAGDIYLANLDPTKGGEQAGTRPVIILSLHAFNIRSRPVIICPIASNMQPWATKIGLLQEMKTHGMVVVDQIRPLTDNNGSIEKSKPFHRALSFRFAAMSVGFSISRCPFRSVTPFLSP